MSSIVVESATVSQSAPVTEADIAYQGVCEALKAVRNLGPLAVQASFLAAAAAANPKTGALTVGHSVVIQTLFEGCGRSSAVVIDAARAARKAFRERTDTGEAVLKDRYPFAAVSRNGMSGVSLKVTARFADAVRSAAD